MTTLRAFDGDTLLWTMDPADIQPWPFGQGSVWAVQGTKVDAPPPAPPAPPAPIFFPGFSGRVIAPDDHGADVQVWQDRLLHLGFTLPTTGTYDPTSVATTKEFQSAQGLDPSGLIDETTWHAAFHPFAGA